ncbi:aryl-alcohol dehydrogenase-like predicted oxidoreductase [Sphingobacterium allocomposti]|uniref:Aryl-alcohol dehydrogenase-like predicted oxidoreductase n=1 Tax=Sphingobacterium allocomposti TaxID=415956 RepID=A0A5S5DMM8_9SPHI|nr:aldo/keto reductase [Sphingobacterium composti Yoo et al. 2007 non Ten et al. 2007]TYP96985.1 aryl-alcohol dehydrogenase-like predicted oxidoreductase [Sphingobacterium composti Yoo et al. 2007 non Ten et al. 2007]
MQRIKIGKSALEVAPIGLGTMSLKGGATKLNVDILQQAYESGINYFDTADLYERGMNEDLLGQALSAVRDSVILATKVGNQWRSDGSTWDWKASKPYIIKTVEASLSRLNTSYIDLYQLHGGTIDDPIDEIIEAFEQLVKEGKIRYYGISSIRPNVIRAYAERSNIVSVMMQYSLLDRRPEMVFPLLADKGISVISRGAMTQGILVDKPVDKYLQLTSGEVGHANRNVEKLAERLGISKAHVLLAYVLGRSEVAVAAVGVRTLAQLRDLQRIAGMLHDMTHDEREVLEKGIRKLEYVDHLL